MDKDIEDDKLKPYVVTGHLGKGSFAIVYKGYNEETHKQVAIKTVKRETLGTGKLLDNLQLEIEILKSLSHRHITRLLEIIRADKNIYLIMEFCAGGDLTNYLKKRGRVESLEYSPSPGAAPQYYPHPRSGGLAEIVVRSFLRQLARALKFLRHRKLIHRDIKPQNLLLHPAGPDEHARGHPLGVPVLKLADFGFARSLPNAMMAQTLCGSPLYMAPEILKYEPYGPKVDLWSTGAVLYEMAVGRPPFRAQNHIELINKIERSKGIKFPDEEPQKTTNTDAQPVPQDIKDLIRALLKRLPVERADYEQFFASPAMQNSKFSRPVAKEKSSISEDTSERRWTSGVPEHHKIIPPEVLDPNAMIPPSKFNFRRPSGGVRSVVGGAREAREVVGGARAGDDVGNEAGPSTERNSPPGGGGLSKQPSGMSRQTSGMSRQPSDMSRQAAPGPSRTPPNSTRVPEIEPADVAAETEEYVLVDDTRALEFDQAVDQLREPPRRPSQTGRRASAQQYQAPQPHLQPRRVSTYGVSRPEDVQAPDHSRKHERTGKPQHRRSSTFAGQGTPPSGSPTLGDGPSSEFMAERPMTTVITTFPPAPSNGIPPPSPALSSSPSRAAASALNRALSLASKTLFGSAAPRSVGEYMPPSSLAPSPASRANSALAVPAASTNTGDPAAADADLASSPRRPQLIRTTTDEERDPLEDALLARLEELAQKTDVLMHWADELYEQVKAVPRKPWLDPTEVAEERRPADAKAEYDAVTCVAVYMLLMSFAQKGIDQLRRYQEEMLDQEREGEYVVSEGFDDALSWFRDYFLKCHERVKLVKAWLPANYDGPKTWLDQLVYDRALTLSRTAARKELLDQATAPDECEKLYEESLWCLYALQDDLLQSANMHLQEDCETVATWIKRTKLRLLRCRARMVMSDRDRLNDARADENLTDVVRIPAPWDALPS